MKNKLCVAVIIGLFSFSMIFAYSLPESSSSGELVGAVTGKYTALGEAAVSGEVWTNPAFLTKTYGLTIEVAGGFIKSGERRKKSIFDSFDNRVGDVTVADNSFIFSETTCLSVSYTTSFAFGLGINVIPLISYDYRYEREIRDDFYVLQETIREKGEGDLYLINIGAAYELLRGKLSLGFGVDLYSGERVYEYSREYVDPSNDDVSWELPRTLGGNGAVFGFSANPFDRVAFSGFSSTKVPLGDLVEDCVPLRMGGGVVIIPPNSLPANFLMDAVFEKWSGVDSDYLDVIKLHLGVEHAFSPILDGRFGFGYETSYLSENMSRVFFTFGFGLEKGGYDFDTGVKICSYDFSGDELEMDQENISRVEESLVKLIFSINYCR
jgi:hypothetical protein